LRQQAGEAFDNPIQPPVTFFVFRCQLTVIGDQQIYGLSQLFQALVDADFVDPCGFVEFVDLGGSPGGGFPVRRSS
jgi:hypothetical protein